MKHTKKALSFILALVMLISASSVGFFAFAADGEEINPVAELESRIDTFSSDHSRNLYSSDATKKEAAKKEYDAINASFKTLSESQIYSMDMPHYAFWLTTVQNDIARTISGKPSSTPSTAYKVEVMANHISDIEAVMGSIPKDYKAAFEAFKPYSEPVDVQNNKNVYLYDVTKIDFKKCTKASEILDELAENIGKLSLKSFLLSDFLSPASGGFSVNAISIKSADGTTAGNIVKPMFYRAQDLMTESGGYPSFSNRNYVKRTGKSGAYVYEWVKETSAQDYLTDYENYYELYKSDVVAPANYAYQELYKILANFSEYKEFAEMDAAVTKAATKLVNGEAVTDTEVQAVVDKHDSMSPAAKTLYNAIASKSDSKVLAYKTNEYTAETITPELAYTKASGVSTYKLSDLYNKLVDYINNLHYDDYIKYMENVNLSKKTDSIIKTAQQKYAILPSEYKNKIPTDIFEKFTALVTPDKDMSDLSAQIKAFKQTKVKLPINNHITNKKGGIQYAINSIWDIIANTVVPLISSETNLSKGLDSVLESKVYTNEMASKIFDLYATLSHSDMMIESGSLKVTLGFLVGMITSPSDIANKLQETKYAEAAAKIKTASNFDELAALEFKNGELGFDDGDRNGFIDTVLALLRPVTALLLPDGGIMGIKVGAKFVDYLGDDGVYTNGAYASLIPLLEQLGVTSLPTEEEYKDNLYNAIDTKGKVIAADELVKPIINALLTDVVDEVSADPLNGVLKLLPRVASVISSNMLNDSVKAALSQLGMLSALASSIDLSSDAINNKLTSIDLTSVAGTSCVITLSPINWGKLANCATVKSVKSVSNSNAYFVLRTGDPEICFTDVFYYIYAVAFGNSTNYNAIKNLINNKLGSLSSVVISITDKIAGKTPVDGYDAFLDMFSDPESKLPGFIASKVTKISADKCKITLSKTVYTYIGRKQRPSVKVTYGENTLKNGTDYTVTYTGDGTSLGRQVVKVTFSGDFVGTKSTYYTIKPKAISLSSVSAGKKAFTAKWKKNSQVTGYEIQYSTSKNFKNAKTIKIDRTTCTSKKFSKLKAKKKYYVRIRVYKELGGVKTYSPWSKAKTVKTK